MAQSKIAITSNTPLNQVQKNNIAWSFMTTSWGEIFLESSPKGLRKCYISDNPNINNLQQNKCTNPVAREIIKDAKKQINLYLKNSKHKFDLPLEFLGSDFQVNVWKCLRKIPSGETLCYQDLALRVGLNNGQRAVGGAVNKNPLMVFIPCHRVIQKNGAIGGFAVSLSIKQSLLLHEGRRFFL